MLRPSVIELYKALREPINGISIQEDASYLTECWQCCIDRCRAGFCTERFELGAVRRIGPRLC